MTTSLRHRPAAPRLALNPIAIAALLALSTAPLATQAGTSTWSGGAPLSFNGDWSTPNNWLNQAVPQSAADTDLVFGATTSGGTGRTTANNNTNGSFKLRTLTFTSAAPAYLLTGNALNLGSGGIVQNSTAAQTVNNTLYLTVSQTWSFASGAGVLNLGQNFNVGAGAALSLGSGTVNLTNSADALKLDGTSAGTATLNLSGTATLSARTVYVGNYGSGTFNQSGGSFTTNGNQLLVGYAAGGSGSYTLSDNTSRLSTGETFVGYAGTGTFNQSGGSFTTNGNALYLAFYAGVSSTYTLSGSDGSLSTGNTFVGYAGSGTFNQSGGSFTTNGNILSLGTIDGGSGTYNLSGGSLTTGRTQVSDDTSTSVFTQSGGTHTTGTLSLTGYATASTGIYNLNGGTLVAGTVTSGDGGISGTSTLNFNGGTLQASAANASFMQGLTHAYVQAGGARVDTAGFDVGIAQALVHDTTAGASPIDGGLTKLGAGTLTLTGSNSFRGGLNIVAGTVAVATESNLGAGSVVDVSGRGTLLFNGSTTLARTYNLGLATLSIGSGNTLTIGNGAALNNGFLAGAGTFAVGNGALLDGTRATSTTISQSAGTATFNNVLLTGASRFTQAAGATLNTTGDFTANPQTTLVVNGAVNLQQGGSISGGLTINNGGVVTTTGGASSALYLDGSRGTTVNAGGQLNAASGSTIELGGLLVNNGTQSGVLDVNLGGLAKGSGSFGTVNVADGGKFSPGNSPGTATAESFSFGAGGRYDFELNTAKPRFGIESDLLVVTNTLFVTAGTSANSVFTIGIDSLNLGNQSAALTDFDGHLAYHWLLVDAGSVSGFDSAKFAIDSSGFSNSLNGGNFSVSLHGNYVYLDFNPVVAAVPEPSAWLMMVLGLAGLGVAARRRQQA